MADASAYAIFFQVGAAEEATSHEKVDPFLALHAVRDPSPGAEELLVERELHGRVADFVDSLPDRLRTIAYRYYWLGENQSDIAAKLGVSRSAICHSVAKITRLGRAFFGITEN